MAADACIFGTHRVLEPLHSLPQPAWRLDNTTQLRDNEVLVDVETININTVSFSQMVHECGGDRQKIAAKIFNIVASRGKLHNPVTGTGGMLVGRIKKIGSAYDNPKQFAVGDRIASLSSLSLTPLKISKIKHIHMHTAQIDVEAEAILFQSAPLIRVPDNLPLTEVLAVLDEAGAPMQAWKLAKESDTVLLLGAGGKLGLLCAFAVRQKLGRKGTLIGVVKSAESGQRIQQAGIFDQVVVTDAYQSLQALKAIFPDCPLADFTINCINTPGTETLSVLATRHGGTVFFANLASNYNSASLTAEGIGRELDIFAYKGYLDGHAEFAIQLLRQYPDLRRLLSARFESKQKHKTEQVKVGASIDLNAAFLKEIGLENYIFESEEIKQVLQNVLRVAAYDCTILFTGESGVGKEIMAQIAHKGSSRSNASLIKINCGSIPPNLLESEFFGYEAGSFTGAKQQGKIGIFEAAHGGTLFLDEIGELPVELQVKLLRAIQEKEIYRVGGIRPIQVDVRILAATNQDLRKMVKEGRFREDLFYRLNVFPVHIPPLRERKADILPLAHFFLEKYNAKFRMNKSFLPSALTCLLDYSWPGNVREMENTIQRILLNSRSDALSAADITANLTYEPQQRAAENTKNISLKSALEETEYQLLKDAKRRFRSTREMARYLQMSQTTLIRRLKKYQL